MWTELSLTDARPARPAIDPDTARTLKVERKKREIAARKRMKVLCDCVVLD